MQNQCEVRSCDSRAERAFSTGGDGGGVPLECAVCTFHHTALTSGEVFQASDDFTELVIGGATVPEVINVIVDDNGIGLPVVTLTLGHDGIENSRVSFRIGPEKADSLHYWTGTNEDPTSPLTAD